MLQAYFNYPNSYVSVHSQSDCSAIRQQRKEGQRIVTLEVGTLSAELATFIAGERRFGSTSSINDMWLHVELDDLLFERATIEYVRSILSQRYSPFRVAVIDHC